MSRKSVEDLLMNEVGAYWLGEELGDVTWTSLVEDRLPGLAAQAAARLRYTVGEDRRPELQALLRAIRADPRHPLAQQIEAETQVEWSDDPVTWSVFQRLMDLLLQAI